MATPSLKIGDGKWAVKEDKLLGYHESENKKWYSPREGDFVRATTGTVVNSNGYIEEVPYNLLGYSQELDNAYWALGTGDVITSNIEISPNGTLTADKFTVSTTSTQHWIYKLSVPVIDSNDYVYSFYAKAGGYNHISMRVITSSTVGRIAFDLNLGTVTNTVAGTGTITDVGNGWYRCEVAVTTDSASANIYLNVEPSSGASGNVWSGNGSDGIYVWGAQLVKGTSPKDYFKTTDRLNIPRICFKDSTEGALLMEPQRTNLITYSEEFTDASWSPVNSGVADVPVVTDNYAISPDGTMNAARVQFELNGGTSSSDFSQLQASFSQTNGIDYNVSFYLKSNTGVNQIITIVDPSGAAQAVTVTSDWQRFDFTGTTISTTGQPRLRTRGSEGSTDSADILVYGGQYEEGSYPTSYIPTSGSTVTRNADEATGFGTSADFNSEEGVLFVKPATLVAADADRYIGISSGSTNERAVIRYNAAANQIAALYTVGGSNQCSLSNTLSDSTDFNKIAFRWKVNDFSLWVNGTEVASDISGSVNAAGTFDELSLDNARSGSKFYGRIEQIETYNYLDDAAMAELTT